MITYGRRCGSAELQRRRNTVKRGLYLVVFLLACLAIAALRHAGVVAKEAAQGVERLDWPYYDNDLGNMRFVDADQITPANVGQLRPAWVFHTGVGTAKTSPARLAMTAGPATRGATAVHPYGPRRRWTER